MTRIIFIMPDGQETIFCDSLFNFNLSLDDALAILNQVNRNRGSKTAASQELFRFLFYKKKVSKRVDMITLKDGSPQKVTSIIIPLKLSIWETFLFGYWRGKRSAHEIAIDELDEERRLRDIIKFYSELKLGNASSSKTKPGHLTLVKK